MSIRALLVDDETLDRELLRSLIVTYCSSLTVIDEAGSVSEAADKIALHAPDIVFLDIHMPNANGFTLLERFPEKQFLVVFTTGHDDYGIKAVKAGAFDYLMKPIDVDELLAMEQRLMKHMPKPESPGQSQIRIFHQGEHLFIRAQSIICLEAEGSYVKIYRSDGERVIISKNLRQVMSDLNVSFMKRVHRSFVVNINHILSYHSSGNALTLSLTGGIEAKVARQYKAVMKDVMLRNAEK